MPISTIPFDNAPTTIHIHIPYRDDFPIILGNVDQDYSIVIDGTQRNPGITNTLGYTGCRLSISYIESTDGIEFIVQYPQATNALLQFSIRMPHLAVVIGDTLTRCATGFRELPSRDQCVVVLDHGHDLAAQDAEGIPAADRVAHHRIGWAELV